MNTFIWMIVLIAHGSGGSAIRSFVLEADCLEARLAFIRSYGPTIERCTRIRRDRYETLRRHTFLFQD